MYCSVYLMEERFGVLFVCLPEKARFTFFRAPLMEIEIGPVGPEVKVHTHNETYCKARFNVVEETPDLYIVWSCSDDDVIMNCSYKHIVRDKGVNEYIHVQRHACTCYS